MPSRNETDLERLFSLSLEMLCIAGVDGHFKRVNPAFERTLGYSPDEMISCPFIEFIHPDDREKTLAEVRKLSEGIPTVRFVNRYRRKDGECRWLQWMAMPQADEGLIYASASDITDQRRAEEWFRAALELAPDAIVITDRGGKIVLVNAQAENVFGYRDEELVGQSVELLLPERFRAAHVAHRSRFGAEPKIRGMGARPDLPARRKDGSEFLAEISLGPIHTEAEVLTFAVIRDVTERRRVEKALRDNEAQLVAARRIQQYFLPRTAPSVPGYDIAGASYPAEFTAGDHFDYVPMAGSTLGIVIGDVSGHGFGPALLTVAVHNHLRALVEHHDQLDEILGDANRLLSEQMDEEYFVTLLMGQLDPGARTFRYINAGHPNGYLLDASGGVKARLRGNVPPLGILPELAFQPAESVSLTPGDLLLLVTDGVLEARAANGEYFGEERMLQIVQANRHRPAREILDALCDDVREFSKDGKIADDVTAVVIKVQT
jgi:PAS domain S-box-containing protein